MSVIKGTPKFFYGALTPGGFKSFYDRIYNIDDGWRVCIIKGGPGSGKSTIMKKLADENVYKNPVIGLCANDPDSFDAVIFPQEKFCVVDGTAPHIIEPKYPGICETVINTSDCWDEKKLCSNKNEILSLYHEKTTLHERAARYTSAIGTLLNDNYRLTLDLTLTGKAACFATSFAMREFGTKKEARGKEDICYISAMTPNGHILLEDTVHSLCGRVIAIEDEACAASRIILAVLREAALDSGFNIITCPCPFTVDEKIEHLLIPELSLAICTSNRWHHIRNAERRIHSRRFTDIEKLRERKHKIAFNRKTASELMNCAAVIMGEAKIVHNKIEKYYIDAMDFELLEGKYEKLRDDLK